MRVRHVPLFIPLTPFQVVPGKLKGEAGLSQLREGRAAYRATGAELYRSLFLALLAESYAQGGQFEAGLATVVEALGVVESTGEQE